MDQKRISSIWVALMGVLIGVLLALTWQSALRSPTRKIRVEAFSKIDLVLDQIQKRYVDTVDTDRLTEAAIVAALAELDPHSVYMPPVLLEESETELAGNFDGIGIQFNVPNDTAIVLEVIPGGPSEKIGLLPGDRILRVDDKIIAGVQFPQDNMVRRMKGPAGTKVLITVRRDGEEIPFEITRGKIPVHCVDAAFMVNDTTGYIRLSKFTRTTFNEVSHATATLMDEGMKRLIFDLRDNTGGYFDQSMMLCNQFLPKGASIVYMEGLHQKREEYKADGKGMFQQLNLVVLINENSASSSEIFAGAIQDNDRGLLVGRRSFGKGLVQEPINFTDGSGIRLTIARYYTPSGRCIQKPYDNTDEYAYDIYHRYTAGEMISADSIRVDSTKIYKTVGGRTVYGGGGITPDRFVPIDTTRATQFYIACNRKATQMRFASDIFDQYKGSLSVIDNYKDLEAFLNRLDIPTQFQRFAARKDGIKARPGEWAATKDYLLPQLRALIGRYSKLGDNAFYKLYLPVDTMMQAAIATD